MNWFYFSLVLVGFITVTHSVLLSLEESEVGQRNYRYLYFNVPVYDGTYKKPFFTLRNGNLVRPYGTLGALDCPSGTSGAAYYKDYDGDGLKEWVCLSINDLPFANEGGSEINPPLCDSTVQSGTPTLYNATTDEWYCAGMNHILTAAERAPGFGSCTTADFMYYDGFLDEIRCISPQDIDESATAQGKRDIEERVDTEDDKKWHATTTQMDVTNNDEREWYHFLWTPSINYDFSASASLHPSPPIAYPWATQLIAVSMASFEVNGYLWNILPPTSTDSFVGEVFKLDSSLTATPISTNLLFNSVSATTGQVTFGLSTLASTTATAGQTFVASFNSRRWTAFTGSDRHLISITLWIEMNESFTDFFFTGK